MRRFLFWFLLLVLVGGTVGSILFMLQPRPSLHHHHQTQLVTGQPLSSSCKAATPSM